MLSKNSHTSGRLLSIAILVVVTLLVTRGYTQPIDLTRPVGLTEGSAGSGNGAASYVLPIDIPNGVKGVQPQVSLSYSSMGGGSGLCGQGWTLSPMSVITRAGKNVFHNGVATPVQYTGANDAFVLDGQRLMLVSGTNSP